MTAWGLGLGWNGSVGKVWGFIFLCLVVFRPLTSGGV